MNKSCPDCGFETSVSKIRKKVGKKLIMIDYWVRYCKHADCTWEEMFIKVEE